MALCESNCSGIGSLLSVGVGVGQPTRYPMLRPPTPIASRPVGLQPTDSIRGHPRLGAVDTKAWMRGSSPRKTALTRSHGVQHKCQFARKFSPDRPAPGGEG